MWVGVGHGSSGLFGAALGMRRTFILHARGTKLPSDLLGLTCVRYGNATAAAEMRALNQKLRQAIEDEGRAARTEGMWWQFSITARSSEEPSAVSLLRVSRNRDGALELSGRSWQEDGTLSARYWSEASKEEEGSFWHLLLLERRTAPARAPRLEGTGEIRVEFADRAAGYWTTRSDAHPHVNARASGVYLRADPQDMSTGRSATRRVDRRTPSALEVDYERVPATPGSTEFGRVAAMPAPATPPI